VRALVILIIVSTPAFADPVPPFKLVEDDALGIQLQPDKPLLGDPGGLGKAIIACTAAVEPSNGALFWLEINRAGAITNIKVRGSGKPVVDTCLASALRKAKIEKLAEPIVLVGHIDLKVHDREAFYSSPRESKTSVLLAPHDAKWQLTVSHLAYTANRAADIAQALDGASTAIAACAPKRGASAEAAEAIAWTDGKSIVRSGTPAYDECIVKALDAVKLPAPDSALWMKLAITAPSEPLAARTDKAALSRDQALRDALTTAVRSRKEILRGCLDGKPKATLVKVSVALAAAKAKIAKVETGDPDANTCVRTRFGDVAIPNAKTDDQLELEVTLDRQ
jgi:hypothetical protein